jgi:hypothetical protein
MEVRMLPHRLMVVFIRLALEESDQDNQWEELVVVLADTIKQTASSDEPSGTSSEQ